MNLPGKGAVAVRGPGTPRRGARFAQASRAFTLVETAIAIGIVAVALVGLMGVFPIALAQIGNARNNVVVAELAETSLAKASGMDFNSLGSLDNTKKLYDVGGLETSEIGRAVYEVQLVVTNSSNYAQTVIVSVYRSPRKATSTPLAEFISVLADNGR